MNKSILVLLLVCGLLFTGCSKPTKHQTRRVEGPPKSDVEFAKEVFQLLAEGDESVAEMIDWEHLTVPGVADAGAKYRETDDEDMHERFRTAFIGSYSNAFKNSGGRVENVSNWREQSRDSSNTIVAANGPGGRLLLITVTHINGQQKVSTFDLR